jgi:hypothetical protein
MNAWRECQSCAWLRQRYNAPQPTSPPAYGAAKRMARLGSRHDALPAEKHVEPERQANVSTWTPTSKLLIDLYRPVQTFRPRNRSPVQEWLLEELRRGSGEVDAGSTIERALAAGITDRPLRRANTQSSTDRPPWETPSADGPENHERQSLLDHLISHFNRNNTITKASSPSGV